MSERDPDALDSLLREFTRMTGKDVPEEFAHRHYDRIRRAVLAETLPAGQALKVLTGELLTDREISTSLDETEARETAVRIYRLITNEALDRLQVYLLSEAVRQAEPEDPHDHTTQVLEWAANQVARMKYRLEQTGETDGRAQAAGTVRTGTAPDPGGKSGQG